MRDRIKENEMENEIYISLNDNAFVATFNGGKETVPVKTKKELEALEALPMEQKMIWNPLQYPPGA